MKNMNVKTVKIADGKVFASVEIQPKKEICIRGVSPNLCDSISKGNCDCLKYNQAMDNFNQSFVESKISVHEIIPLRRLMGVNDTGEIPDGFYHVSGLVMEVKAKIATISFEAVVKSERHTGRTTRMVDDAIQELFNTGVVKVRDHHEGKHADRLALALVKDRLFREHEHVKWLSDREDPFTLHLVQGLSDKEVRELKNEY